MKHILLPFLFMIFSVSIYADKYDDLVMEMNTQTPNIAFYNYQQYQKKNPQIGNVYYQLAKISYDYLRQTNPIYNLKAFRYYAYNAKLYYSSCLHFATENEVRKYAAHYTDIPFAKKPNLDALNAHIRPILEDIATISDTGNKLNAAYVHLLSKYEHCVQIYLALNTKFDSFNDALLQATTDDIHAMHQLQTISDSIPEYIATYQKALEEYKIDGYSPVFKIVPIELFRIDALCSVNFLVNNVVLYDFGAWVRQFNTRRNTRVIPILNKAHKSYQTLIEKTNYQAPISLINSLYQLDPTSYPAAVLQIQNVYNQVKNNYDNFADAPNDDKRMAMLYDMSKILKIAKEQHTRLKTLTVADMQKYTDFTATYFPKTMPYEVLAHVVKKTDSIYNTMLQDFRTQKVAIAQPDTNAIIKTNINIEAKPKAIFHLYDSEQLVLAYDVFNDTLSVWKTKIDTYDIKNQQLGQWIVLPRVENIAYVTTTDKGYAIVVNEDTTKAVAFYFIDNQNQITHRPILTSTADIISVGHYNPDTFVLYLMIEGTPQLMLVDKN